MPFAYTLATLDQRFLKHFLQSILKDLRCLLLQLRSLRQILWMEEEMHTVVCLMQATT